MSDALNANQSPAGPGQQVRTLSKKPLYLLGLVVLIFFAAFVWSGMQRGQTASMLSDDEATIEAQGEGAAGHLLGGVKDGQVTDPLGTSVLLDDLLKGGHGMFTEAKPEPKPVIEVTEPMNKPVPELPPPPPEPELPVGPSPAEIAARERLERAGQLAYEQFVRALSAPVAVNIGVSDGGQTTQNPTNSQRSGGGPDTQADYRTLHQQAIQRLQNQQLQQQALAGLAGLQNQRVNQWPSANLPYGHHGAINSGYNGNRHNRQVALTRQAVKGKTMLNIGTVIPTVLITGINSDLPGEILAQVTEDVFDTASGQHVLIPRGAKLAGRYVSDIEEGQERVGVIWYRINYPDSSTLDLSAIGTDLAGYSGLHDQVDHHTVDKFKEATLLSLITGAAQLSQSGSDDASQQMIGALGQQYAQIGQAVVKRKLDKAPTITIRPGMRFNVFINQDIVLKPYLQQ